MRAATLRKMAPAPSPPVRSGGPSSKPVAVVNSPNPSRHARKCKVCHHANRPDIEREFLRGCSPSALGQVYGLQERSIYRHVEALALDQRRNRSQRHGLGRILERSGEIKITDNLLIRVVRAFAHINNDAGRWVEPKKTRHVISLDDSAAEVSASQPAAAAASSSSSPSRRSEPRHVRKN